MCNHLAIQVEDGPRGLIWQMKHRVEQSEYFVSVDTLSRGVTVKQSRWDMGDSVSLARNMDCGQGAGMLNFQSQSEGLDEVFGHQGLLGGKAFDPAD